MIQFIALAAALNPYEPSSSEKHGVSNGWAGAYGTSNTYVAVSCAGLTYVGVNGGMSGTSVYAGHGSESSGLGNNYETCRVPGTVTDSTDCEAYYTYSVEMERYVQCQGPTSTGHGGLGRRKGDTRRLRCVTRPNYHAEHRNFGTGVGYDPEKIKLCRLDESSPEVMMAEMAEKQGQLEQACADKLCSYARSGGWNGLTAVHSSDRTAGISLPWPKSVSGWMHWGWRHTARKKCSIRFKGFDLINVETLFGNLVVDEFFNKEVCGCASRDDCTGASGAAAVIEYTKEELEAERDDSTAASEDRPAPRLDEAGDGQALVERTARVRLEVGPAGHHVDAGLARQVRVSLD